VLSTYTYLDAGAMSGFRPTSSFVRVIMGVGFGQSYAFIGDRSSDGSALIPAVRRDGTNTKIGPIAAIHTFKPVDPSAAAGSKSKIAECCVITLRSSALAERHLFEGGAPRPSRAAPTAIVVA
jgi:hypothetical protein